MQPVLPPSPSSLDHSFCACVCVGVYVHAAAGCPRLTTDSQKDPPIPPTHRWVIPVTVFSSQTSPRGQGCSTSSATPGPATTPTQRPKGRGREAEMDPLPEQLRFRPIRRPGFQTADENNLSPACLPAYLCKDPQGSDAVRTHGVVTRGTGLVERHGVRKLLLWALLRCNTCRAARLRR
ncbi:hypothetical protein GQ53DRAFT_132791 [Thozetella sp. PMI_491]|nr:hypothetical protein GQ53DRAFT_132791 [Thozetella sp. PMI_491]